MEQSWHRQAEIDLRLALQHMQFALPAMVYVCQAGGAHGATFVSQNAAVHLGYEPREFIDDPRFWLERVHPEDLPRVLAEEAALYEAGHLVREYRFRHKDGSYRWLLDEAKLIGDTGGRPAEIVGYFVDITERKIAEAELARHSRQWDAAQRMAHVGSWEWDLLTNALRWSDEHYRIFGFEPGAEVDFDASFRIIHPDDRALVTETITAALEGRKPYDLELRIERADGSRGWIWTRGEFVRDATGQPVRMVGTLQDITDRKAVEHALQTSEQQLREVMEEREQLSRDLHDTILQTIYAVGFSVEESQRLIEEDLGQAAVARLSATIVNLNETIREIREFIAGQQRPALTGQQLRAELKAIAQTIKAAHLVRFRIHIDPLAASRLSPDEARHMLGIAREAMSNAMRHSRAKAGVVSLVAHDDGVRLELKDNGIGMDFPAIQGRGQGLANIVSRANAIGARLEIQSAPDSGTRIVVDLPKRVANGVRPDVQDAIADRR